MKEVHAYLDRILAKVKELKSHNNQLAEENEQLISQVIELKEGVDDREKRIKELENKTINLQFSKSINKEEKDKINQRIDELIAEIDKGLELLRT